MCVFCPCTTLHCVLWCRGNPAYIPIDVPMKQGMRFPPICLAWLSNWLKGSSGSPQCGRLIPLHNWERFCGEKVTRLQGGWCMKGRFATPCSRCVCKEGCLKEGVSGKCVGHAWRKERSFAMVAWIVSEISGGFQACDLLWAWWIPSGESLYTFVYTKILFTSSFCFL